MKTLLKFLGILTLMVVLRFFVVEPAIEDIYGEPAESLPLVQTSEGSLDFCIPTLIFGEICLGENLPVFLLFAGAAALGALAIGLAVFMLVSGYISGGVAPTAVGIGIFGAVMASLTAVLCALVEPMITIWPVVGTPAFLLVCAAGFLLVAAGMIEISSGTGGAAA